MPQDLDPEDDGTENVGECIGCGAHSPRDGDYFCEDCEMDMINEMDRVE